MRFLPIGPLVAQSKHPCLDSWPLELCPTHHPLFAALDGFEDDACLSDGFFDCGLFLLMPFPIPHRHYLCCYICWLLYFLDLRLLCCVRCSRSYPNPSRILAWSSSLFFLRRQASFSLERWLERGSCIPFPLCLGYLVWVRQLVESRCHLWQPFEVILIKSTDSVQG
jgi:hypothetical protein